jgi:hypothetical protein
VSAGLYPRSYFCNTACEIVGNIYENRELLYPEHQKDEDASTTECDLSPDIPPVVYMLAEERSNDLDKQETPDDDESE